MEELLAKLREVAASDACCDDPDFSIYDYSGGNYDDAYYAGQGDGAILLARELLKLVN